MANPSYFLITDLKTGEDYTPEEVKALVFDQVAKDGTTTLSWIAKFASDNIPKKGAEIIVRFVYGQGPRADLFLGKVSDHIIREGDRTLKIVCQGALG